MSTERRGNCTALFRRLKWAVALAVGTGVAGAALAQDIKVGLVAAMTGQSAQSGEAIARGLTIAIDEINAKGGILGRKVVLVRRDDESSPPRGVAAARELVLGEKVAALFGGLDTPVSLAIVPIMNNAKVPFMGVWAAGTNITKNGAEPNYVFRVSAQDDLVDVALIRYAQREYKANKPGLVLVNNPWGESNERGLKAAAAAARIDLAGIEKVDQGDTDVSPQLTRLQNAGADAIILVANVGPGSQVMKSRERMGWKVPVVSHWGISGGRFDELAGPTASDARFVQTFSFFGPQKDTGKRVMAALGEKYGVKAPADIFAPVGIANAYDGMHLLARAMERAKSTDGEAIRKALYQVEEHQGLIKTYRKPFGPNDHEALDPEDYIMVRYEGGKIVPVK